MDENMIKDAENVEATEATVEETTVESTTNETTEEASTTSENTTETPVETVEGEEVKEGEGSGDKAGMVEALGAMMGGIAETYNKQQETQDNLSKTLETQKQIFENFDNDINATKSNIDLLNNAIREMDTTITEVQSSLTATKMYTQLLTKAILISDAVLVVLAIISLIISIVK